MANEQLQFFFNEHIFTLEMEEYEREGIGAVGVTFRDNKSLLVGKGGREGGRNGGKRGREEREGGKGGREGRRNGGKEKGGRAEQSLIPACLSVCLSIHGMEDRQTDVYMLTPDSHLLARVSLVGPVPGQAAGSLLRAG